MRRSSGVTLGALALTLASCKLSITSDGPGDGSCVDDPSKGLVATSGRSLVCTTCGTDLWQGAHLGPLAIAADGNVLVAGAYGGEANFGAEHLTTSLDNPYGSVAFLAKLGRTGETLWFASYPQTENSWIRGLVALADGGAVAIGSTAGGTLAELRRYSASGALTSTLPVSDDNEPVALAVAPDGDLVVTSVWVQSANGIAEAWGPSIEKMGLDGTVRFSRRFTSTGSGANAFASVTVDAEGRIFVAGSVGGSSTDGLDVTAPAEATTAVVAGFDAQGNTAFVRSWPTDDSFPLTVVLTAEGHPLVGGTLTEPVSLGGDVLVPANHGFTSSSATGGCDGCPPPSHDASPFLLELGADGSYLHSRVLEVPGAAGITTMAVSPCSILAAGDADGGQYLAVLAPDTGFVRALPFRAYADPNLSTATRSVPMSLGARGDGSYAVAGTFRGVFSFGSLSLQAPDYPDSGFVVDGAKLTE
ncbi:MAG: hypothetical protein U0414_05880 [Polyangiaceae bacterium]